MHVFTLVLVNAGPDIALKEVAEIVEKAATRHGAECWNPVGRYYARMDEMWSTDNPVFAAKDLPRPLPDEALPGAYVDTLGRLHSRPYDDLPKERFERWRNGLQRAIDRLQGSGGCVVRYDLHF